MAGRKQYIQALNALVTTISEHSLISPSAAKYYFVDIVFTNYQRRGRRRVQIQYLSIMTNIETAALSSDLNFIVEGIS